MKNFGLLVGLLAVMMLTIRIGVLNTNRLVSDLVSNKERKSMSEVAALSDDLRSNAKRDLYKNQMGYQLSDSDLFLPNPLEKTDIQAKVLGTYDLTFEEPLFLVTDRGNACLTLPLPNTQWAYNPNMVGWDGTKLTLPQESTDEYYLYILNIWEGNTERLDNLYSLDYYTKIPEGKEYTPNLEGGVGILLQVKDRTVASYFILNQKLESYQSILAYDLTGKEVFRLSKNALSRYLPIPASTEMDMVTGHYIKLNFDWMDKVELDLNGHTLTRIDSPIWNGEVSYNQEDLEIKLSGEQDSYVELEIYGTDTFRIKVNYNVYMK